MAVDRWQQIESLFEHAIALALPDREEYLRKACADDLDLYREVASLLEHDDSDGQEQSWAATAAAQLVVPEAHVRDRVGRLTPGTALGPYIIQDVAGVGAMGEVYRARDARLDRDVAIKTLPVEFAHDSHRRARLEREARVLGSLNHPRIAAIHDLLETTDGTYLVLEFVPGMDLASRLRSGPLPLHETLRISHDLADALQAAHAKGVVHSDLKPANIKVSDEGHAKVLDFGVAKLTSTGTAEVGIDVPHGDPSRGAFQTLLGGTPAYMSPEQAAGEPVDNRTDIWAFGCVFYELLTGKRAFDVGATSSAAMPSLSGLPGQILSAQPAHIGQLNPTVPRRVEQIVDRCLRRNRDDRYQSATALLTDLQDVEAEWESRRSPARTRHRVLNAFGFAMLVTVGSAFYFSQPGELKVERTRRLTVDSELELDPALSPDGTMLAYAGGASNETERTDIFVRPLSGGDSVNLTRDIQGGHRWPRWSPDGKVIAFITRYQVAPLYAESVGDAIIQVMSVLGGAATTIANAGVVGHTWSPDGKKIAYASGGEIYVAELNGTTRSRIAEAYQPHSLSWSPDGKWIAYASGNPEYLFRMLGNQAPAAVEIVSAGGGMPRRLTDNTSLNMSPVWTPDSRSLLFVSDRGGTRDVFELKLSGSGEPVGAPRRLTTGVNALSVELSKDGRHLAYPMFLSKNTLWSIAIPETSASAVSIAGARPLTSEVELIEGVSASKDGLWLAFDSNRGGNQDIYRMPRAGGKVQQLTTDSRDDFLPAWSPDGQSIAFYSFRTGNRDIFVMSADGKDVQQLTNDPAQERYPSWSPDGQSLIFDSDKGGRPQLFIVSKEGATWGLPRQFTTDGGVLAKWSPDGQYIAYLSGGIRIARPSGGATQLIVARQQSFAPEYLAWSSDGQTLLFKARDENNRAGFWSVPVHGGPLRHLVRFDDAAHPSPRIEFAADDKDLFFTMSERDSDIWLLDLRR